jgi:3-oxoacyl-[acyl-carrier protein] reductase
MNISKTKAIVTGAARGLGRCFTEQLASQGATVAACDIDGDGLSDLCDACDSEPGHVFAGRLDVTDEEAVTSFVKAVTRRLDGVNVLVNNAGILRDGRLAKPESDWTKTMPTAQWQDVIDVNLTGPFLMTREFVSSMLDQGVSPGIVVNVSSLTRTGNPGQSNYAAAKAGLDACTRTWALELAPYGIRVAGIAPGVIDTPILDDVSEEALTRIRENIPTGRIGKPEEVWQALAFVIECDYFTGRTLEVDGGATFHTQPEPSGPPSLTDGIEP